MWSSTVFGLDGMEGCNYKDSGMVNSKYEGNVGLLESEAILCHGTQRDLKAFKYVRMSKVIGRTFLSG